MLTGVIHERASSLWMLGLWAQTDPVSAELAGAEPFNQARALAREVEPRVRELMSEEQEEEAKRIESKLADILAPERKRQHEDMVAAMKRVVDLIWPTTPAHPN